MNEPIKLMRLKTGEDVIAQVLEDSDKVVLINPMNIFFKRVQTGKALILLSPWTPIEIVSDNMIEMHIDNIMSFMKPRQSLIKHYVSTVEKMLDSIIEDEDLEMSFDEGTEEDDEDGYSEDYTEEEFEEKKKLH